MSAQKDESGVVDFLRMEKKLHELEERSKNYNREIFALEKKLANGTKNCREIRQIRLNNLKTSLLPQTERKIESIRSLFGVCMP